MRSPGWKIAVRVELVAIGADAALGAYLHGQAIAVRRARVTARKVACAHERADTVAVAHAVALALELTDVPVAGDDAALPGGAIPRLHALHVAQRRNADERLPAITVQPAHLADVTPGRAVCSTGTARCCVYLTGRTSRPVGGTTIGLPTAARGTKPGSHEENAYRSLRNRRSARAHLAILLSKSVQARLSSTPGPRRMATPS